MVVLLVVQSVEQGYQPAKSIDQILGELRVLYRQYMECGNGNAELIRMAAIIRSSNRMPPRLGDILRLLGRHGRFRMQQTGGTVLIGVTYGNEPILRIPSYIRELHQCLCSVAPHTLLLLCILFVIFTLIRFAVGAWRFRHCDAATCMTIQCCSSLFTGFCYWRPSAERGRAMIAGLTTCSTCPQCGKSVGAEDGQWLNIAERMV